MPWIHILDADRKPTGSVHINFGPKKNREFRHCVFCLREKLLQPCDALCDGKWASGQSCDAPICAYHATHVQGEDLDFCPLHKSQAPLTLFDELEAEA
jgi:hypothetical protein